MSDQTPPNLPPAGWYLDTDGRQQWWDGSAWSGHFKPDAVSEQVADVSQQPNTPLQPDAPKPGSTESTKPTPTVVAESKSLFTRKRVIIPVLAVLLIALSTAVVLVVTAGPSAQDKRDAAHARAVAREKKAAVEAAENDARLQTACTSELSDFKSELENVNSKLTVGMTQSDFNKALGDVQVKYDRLDSDAINGDVYCSGNVGEPLQDAFNDFVKSNSAWAKCINAYNCEVKGDVLKGLQKQWSSAGAKIEKANAALADYTPSAGN